MKIKLLNKTWKCQTILLYITNFSKKLLNWLKHKVDVFYWIPKTILWQITSDTETNSIPKLSYFKLSVNIRRGIKIPGYICECCRMPKYVLTRFILAMYVFNTQPLLWNALFSSKLQQFFWEFTSWYIFRWTQNALIEFFCIECNVTVTGFFKRLNPFFVKVITYYNTCFSLTLTIRSHLKSHITK